MHILKQAHSNDADKLWSLRTKTILAIPSSFYEKASTEMWANKRQFPQFKSIIEENFYLIYELKNEIGAGGFLDLKNQSIEAMYVAPELQGKGIGKSILNALLLEARKREMKTVSLSSTLNAEKFYTSLGFKSLGLSKYRFENGQQFDCVEMKIELDAPYICGL